MTIGTKSASSTIMQLFTTVLTGLALVACAFDAPADSGKPPSTTGPTTCWENTQMQKYHCESREVTRCETTAKGSCLTIDVCEEYCFNHDKGAACVDMGPPIVNAPAPKVPTTARDIKVAARNASPQENKHYTCSQDRTGILICKYNFCSTDHYCKSGEECKDNSITCEPKSPSAQNPKSEVRAVPMQPPNTTRKLVARNRGPKDKASGVFSKDRTSVPKCTSGFCATDYYCAKRHSCVDDPAHCKRV